MRNILARAAVLGTILASASAVNAAVLFTTGFENAADFTNFRISFGGEPTGLDSKLFIVADAGNPQPSAEVTNSYMAASDAPVGESVSVESVTIYNAFSYTPATNGPIESITFSIDALTFMPGAVARFAVEQGTSGFFRGFEPIPVDDGPGVYNTITLTLTQDDLPEVDFLNGATPLQFGFELFTSFITQPGQNQAIAANFDNFSVSVVAVVPEPATAALALPAAALLARRRRA